MKGLPVVTEGQRINLRVYRRIFYPIKKIIEGEDYIVYSDTGREREINYKRPEQYDLENPFNRISLIRLAKALNCLRCEETGENPRECSVTICLTRELYDPGIEEVTWVPFEPDKLDSLGERIRKLRRKVEWRSRMKS
ncbi:MAG: hypothetical protein NWE89_15885 [Candidatus Bathyarchaeota archaeon]|nr:hypothetical protein [Candidatus Bathyarchaeota archaeon]